MGQYHIVANLDKREFLHARAFEDGPKLLEFGQSGEGTMYGLALLLARDNGTGGGDFFGKDPDALIGHWAGDRIAIIGDYGEKEPLYDVIREEWRDISKEVVKLTKQEV